MRRPPPRFLGNSEFKQFATTRSRSVDPNPKVNQRDPVLYFILGLMSVELVLQVGR
jgi:hypothetical protein